MNRSDPHLLVLMTPGAGLRTWETTGTLERELKPYRAYVERGWRVTILTYDHPNETPPVPSGITLRRLVHPRLQPLAPVIFRRLARTATVLKTNQTALAWWYVMLAQFACRPILLRCGYVAGNLREATEGSTPGVRLYQMREGWAFRNASYVQVTTEDLRDWVCAKYGAKQHRIAVVPNFVDTDIFRSYPEKVSRSRSVVFVGRLHEVKRLHLLIEACALARVERLILIGDGPQREELVWLSERLRVKISILGQIRQACLPDFLQEAEVFALTSRTEGHPKALIEAMACGMACVGVDVPGISNVISHGKTGLLAQAEPAAIAVALEQLFDNQFLRLELGQNAARYARENYCFKSVMEREFLIVERLQAAWSGGQKAQAE